MLLLLPKGLKIILNTLVICWKEESSGHQFAFIPNHTSQKQLPGLLVQHEASTIKMCVSSRT